MNHGDHTLHAVNLLAQEDIEWLQVTHLMKTLFDLKKEEMKLLLYNNIIVFWDF